MIQNPKKLPKDGQHYVLELTDARGRNHRAEFAQRGASLIDYTVDGLKVVQQFAQNGLNTSFSGEAVFPIPNRTEDGEYEFGGAKYHLNIDDQEKYNKLHGFSMLYWFEALKVSQTSISLALRQPAQKWYPFSLYVEITYTLTDNGLECFAEVQNVGEESAPWGLCFHPWFSTRGPQNGAKLTLPAETIVEVNERSLPVAEVPVYGKFDLRTEHLLGDDEYDHAFGELVYSNGKCEAILEGQDGHKTFVWGDERFKSFQICRRTALSNGIEVHTVAIEPATCYANAFRTGKNLVILEPDEVQEYRWGIRFE